MVPSLELETLGFQNSGTNFPVLRKHRKQLGFGWKGLLFDNPSHLAEDALHYHLESHMNVDLSADYCSTNINTELDLCKWIEKVHALDEKRLHNAVRMEAT